jgi:hypothetical protein
MLALISTPSPSLPLPFLGLPLSRSLLAVLTWVLRIRLKSVTCQAQIEISVSLPWQLIFIPSLTCPVLEFSNRACARKSAEKQKRIYADRRSWIGMWSAGSLCSLAMAFIIIFCNPLLCICGTFTRRLDGGSAKSRRSLCVECPMEVFVKCHALNHCAFQTYATIGIQLLYHPNLGWRNQVWEEYSPFEKVICHLKAQV